MIYNKQHPAIHWFVIIQLFMYTGLSFSVFADQQCNYRYECTEYYPNGTDCRKTIKHCDPVEHCHTKEIKKKKCIKIGVDANGKPTIECTWEVEEVQECH